MMALVERIARATGFRPWVVIAAACLLALGSGLLAKCGYDRAVVSHAVTKASNKVLKKQVKANDTAAEERLRDQQIIAEFEKGMNDAISNPPAGSPASARLRHACQQLRADGVREADLPGPCRY